MTQYAYFDSTATQPAPVLGWYDTGEFTYKNLPASADLLELTASQWADRFSIPFVDNGTLVAPAPLTAAQLLEAAQTKQIATLTAAAEQAIETGFTSSANGTALFYSLTFNDQRRALMAGQVAMSAMARAWASFW